MLGVNTSDLYHYGSYYNGNGQYLWGWISNHDLSWKTNINIYHVEPNTLDLSNFSINQTNYNYGNDLAQTDQSHSIKDIKVLHSGDYLYTGLYFFGSNSHGKSKIGVGKLSNSLNVIDYLAIGPNFWKVTGSVIHQSTTGRVTIGLNCSLANNTPDRWGYFGFDPDVFILTSDLNITGHNGQYFQVSQLCNIIESDNGYPYLKFVGLTHWEDHDDADQAGYCVTTPDNYTNIPFYTEIDVANNLVLDYNIYPSLHGTNSANGGFYNIPNGLLRPLSKQLSPSIAAENITNHSVDVFNGVNISPGAGDYLAIRKQSLEKNTGHVNCYFEPCNINIGPMGSLTYQYGLLNPTNVSPLSTLLSTPINVKTDDPWDCGMVFRWESEEEYSSQSDIVVEQDADNLYISFLVYDISSYGNYYLVGVDGKRLYPKEEKDVHDGWNYLSYSKSMLSPQLYVFVLNASHQSQSKKIIIQ